MKRAQQLVVRDLWKESTIGSNQRGIWSYKQVKVSIRPRSSKRMQCIRACACGEVEDVVGALTPVVGGVAQVFHDLLVELRLLLVAEVEEGQEEEGQEER